MLRNFFKIFLFTVMLFASEQGFSDSDLNSLYKERLTPSYNSLKNLQDLAQKRKKTIIISSLLALAVLLAFVKYFKLIGFITAIVMIAAGYYILMKNGDPLTIYKEEFQKKIISPIAQNSFGFAYLGDKFSKDDIENSNIFSPTVDQFYSSVIYKKDGVKFAYIVATFNTKESASVERLNENKFEGYFIKIAKKNKKIGVLLSDTLKDEVANMDLTMGSFFAKGKRGKRIDGWNSFGEIDPEMIDAVRELKDKKIAISFTKDAIYVAYYQKNDLLKVDVMSDFTLSTASRYQDTFVEIDKIVSLFK